MWKLKGISSLGILFLILAVAVVGLLVYGLNGGFGSGGREGDNEGAGDTEALQAEATIQTTTEAITTNEIVYIEITVSENKYIFNNISYDMSELESLMSIIKETEGKYTVRITDEFASSSAYNELISSLESEKIRYIEVKKQGEENEKN